MIDVDWEQVRKGIKILFWMIYIPGVWIFISANAEKLSRGSGPATFFFLAVFTFIFFGYNSFDSGGFDEEEENEE